MDDVEITDVEGDSPFRVVEEKPPRNQDLGSLSLIAGELLSQYGWYLLVLTVLVYLLIQYLNKRRSSQSRPEPETQQDVDLVVRRQEAMEAARMKMQEELDAKAEVFRERQRQLEEEKRKQKIESWDSMQQGRSYRAAAAQATEESGSSAAVLKPKQDKRPLRSSDYNPLAGGGGGSCSWRPGRRGPSSGG